MNLRDQLLKAGLVDKKRADQAAREQKQAQKQAQGHQVDKATREREEAARAEGERAEREAELVRRRKESETREAERVAATRALLSSRAILRQNRIPVRGGAQRFYHLSPDRRECWKLQVPEWMATDLRCGRLVIAWLDDDNSQVVVIDPLTANRIEAVRPEVILFRNRGPIDTDASQQLYED